MDITTDFLSRSRALLARDYLPLIEQSVNGLDADDVWWRPHERANAIGNLLLHLDGSTRAWILGVAGGAVVERDRQWEFDTRTPLPLPDLLARLRATLAAADAVLARLDTPDLLVEKTFRGEDVTVLWAVYHAVEHFSMHTGQIVTLAGLRRARAAP